MNAKIEKLTVKIGTREIEMTLEEAVALQAELNLVLGSRQPSYWPIIIDRTPVTPVLPFSPWSPYYGPTCDPFGHHTICCAGNVENRN